MKTNVVRLLIPVLITVLGYSAFAGNSGGGGNLKPGNPVSIETVKQYLENIQIPVELAYKYLSVARYNSEAGGYFGTQGSDAALVIGRLTYSGKPNIFDKIRSVKPTIVTDGSCIYDGVSQDGAAYRNPDRVCLDAARIAANPKVGDQDMHLVTVALAAHEYSHLLGTTEEQANYLQDLVQEYISERFAEHYHQYLYTLNSRLTDSLKTLAMAKEDLKNKASWSQICMDLTVAVTAASSTIMESHDNNSGVGFFSRDEFDKSIYYLRVADTFEFACKNDVATNNLRNFVWGSAKAIPDTEYIKRRHPNDKGSVITDAYIPRMDYENTEDVRAGLDSVSFAVKLLQSDLPILK